MQIKRLALFAAPMLTLSAASDDGLAGRVAGTTVNCISAAEAESQVRIVDARTIAYSRTAARTWITHPERACPSLQPFRTLIVERTGATLCRGDRFRTISAPSGAPSGTCFFGAFTPFDRVGKR